jgi:hypothetical protein
VNLVNGALDAETSHGGPRARCRSTASSFVIQCIDDLVQPHQNAIDDVRSLTFERERAYKLSEGIAQVSESDYFLKGDEFRIRLKGEKVRVGC